MDANPVDVEFERVATPLDPSTRFVCLVKVDDIFRRVGEPGTMAEQAQLAGAVRVHLPSEIGWEVSIVAESAVGEVEGVSTDVLYEDALVLHVAHELARRNDWWRREGSHCLVCIMDDHTTYVLEQSQLENLQHVLRQCHDNITIQTRVETLLTLVERKLARLKGQRFDNDLWKVSVLEKPPIVGSAPESDFDGYANDPCSVAARGEKF